MTDVIILLVCLASLIVSYKQMTKPLWRKYQLYKVGKPLELRTGQIHKVSLDGILSGDMLLNEVKCKIDQHFLRSEVSIEAKFIIKNPNFFVLTGVNVE